uniref:E3 ubiquitin-protein ligase TRIM39-like n=1 Tax=Sinocyclocheilus rhinocerous TaxID=307959 RepID=A0A673GSW6_9TELE
MASSSGPLNEELQCSICLDVFTDPVTTPCGHNFCKTCLNKCWTITHTCFCPLCKETFSRRPAIKINTTLREVVQHFKEKLNQEESEVLCDFCDERKQKAVKSCLTCQSSYCETHLEPHHRVPRLKKHTLISAKHERPLELFCRDDQTCNQLLQTQTDVQQMIQNRMKKIQEIQHSVELRKRNTEEEKSASENVNCMYSTLCSHPHTKNWTEISIDSDVNVYSMHRALTQLKKTHETLNEKLCQTGLDWAQKFAVDVTLDPDTAASYLILSDDGKQVSDGDIEQDVPENPKRFDDCCVLAKEGFRSGRFYYEVQVEGKSDWNLGVVRESINRKGEISPSPENGFWLLGEVTENLYLVSDNPFVTFFLETPEKVGVFVDYEEGLVSFYDVESSSHIYSFTGQTFTDKLYPYFGPGDNDAGKNSNPLIISPVSSN